MLGHFQLKKENIVHWTDSNMIVLSILDIQ
jgi:hypothetical protein